MSQPKPNPKTTVANLPPSYTTSGDTIDISFNLNRVDERISDYFDLPGVGFDLRPASFTNPRKVKPLLLRYSSQQRK